MRTLSAIVHKEEDMYVATCPEIGTTSQGKTVEDAVANMKEATELYLEEFPQQGVGTLKGLLKLAHVSEEEFAQHQ